MFSKLIPIGILVILFIILIAVGYVKAPPDRAYIISGLRKKQKVLIGKAGIKIPFLERLDKLILKQISIDIKTNGFIPTTDFIGVDIDAVAKVRMLTEKDITVDAQGNFIPGVDNKDGTKIITAEMVSAAYKNFLNMEESQIKEALTDSLQGNMREIIGTQTLRDLCQDRKAFGDEVQAKAQRDMNALGIWIESCNIQKLEDENGLITALGQDNMSQIQKEASIAKARAEKDVAIEKAEAAKVANDAQVAAQEQIAEKQAQLAKKQAALKKDVDTQNAQAAAADSIESEKQRQLIIVAETNANIAKAEREAELRQREIELKEYELDALIRKQADADRYAAEQRAEAARITMEKEAEAEKYAMLTKAEGIAAIGRAEAEAIEKKAEAQKKMGEASVLEMVLTALPQMVANASAPLTNVDSITLYGEGNSAKMVEDVMTTTNKVVEGLAANGIDLKALLAGFMGGKAAE